MTKQTSSSIIEVRIKIFQLHAVLIDVFIPIVYFSFLILLYFLINFFYYLKIILKNLFRCIIFNRSYIVDGGGNLQNNLGKSTGKDNQAEQSACCE